MTKRLYEIRVSNPDVKASKVVFYFSTENKRDNAAYALRKAGYEVETFHAIGCDYDANEAVNLAECVCGMTAKTASSKTTEELDKFYSGRA